jgi:uncharacterized damage-inducible protein DinB
VISTDYVSMMARYNAWQNNQIIDIVKVMDEEDLRRDRKAFFGSILNTLNHILWGDTIWMSRFSDAFAPPAVPASEHINYTSSPAAWQAARKTADETIIGWAAGLADADLRGDLVWVSGMTGTQFCLPRAQCITHLFTHQTHHRGQVHAMLTASGQSAPVTDIVFMPETA